MNNCQECGQPIPEIPAIEMQMAEQRLAALDALERFCEWDSLIPTAKAQRARERWKRIMDVQGEFEARYC